MFPVDRLLLVAAVLVIFGIISSKFSARLGLPVLVLLVGIGMPIRGSDAPRSPLMRQNPRFWPSEHGPCNSKALKHFATNGGADDA